MASNLQIAATSKSNRKIALIGTIAIAALSLGASDVYAQTKIKLGQVTSITLSFAPVVAAKELGFFKEENLDVDIIEFNGTGTLIPQMTSKRVQIGYPNPDVLIVSQQAGKDPLPLKFFYNATRDSGWEFIVPAESPIKSMKDLNGKQLGVGAMTFGNIPITKAMFKEMGIQVNLVPVGVGSPAFLALRDKKIDGLNLFDAQHATLENQGTAIRRLPMPKKYQDLSSNGFIAHEDMIKNEPKVLAGFGRAVAKGTIYCETNPVACVKAFWRQYPNQKPAGDETKALADGIKIMQSRLNKYLAFNDSAQRRWGEFSPQMWKDFATALYEGGQLSTPNVDVEKAYTNALVPEFSKFDEKAIIDLAKSAK